MTIDETITNERELSEHCKRMFNEMSAEDKLANKLLKSEIEYHSDIVAWLEELKAYKLGECMNNCEHYNNCSDYIYSHGYNKAIDDMYNELSELLYHDFNITLDRLLEVKNQLNK